MPFYQSIRLQINSPKHHAYQRITDRYIFLSPILGILILEGGVAGTILVACSASTSSACPRNLLVPADNMHQGIKQTQILITMILGLTCFFNDYFFSFNISAGLLNRRCLDFYATQPEHEKNFKIKLYSIRSSEINFDQSSAVDPNTFNLDPGPEYWTNLDPNPGICYQF